MYEWVGVEYPGDEGAAWEAAFCAALDAIIEIDAAEDAHEEREVRAGQRKPLYDGAGYYLGTVAS